MMIWIVMILYLVMMVGIGVYCRRLSTDVTGFVLGGRSLGAWLGAFTYGTSYFSAVIFVGYAGKFGWSFGMAATWIGIGNAILGSLLPWLIMGKRTRLMSKHLEAKTMPEFFEKRYASKALKIISALIIFIFLIPYTASVYNGLSRIFSIAFDFDYKYIIIAMAIMTAVYVILGGYMATALTDFVQGIIMLFGITAVVIASLKSVGGLSAAVEGMSKIQDASGETGAYSSFFGPDPINLIGVIILTSLGTWGLPQMVSKFYAVKDNSAIKKGTIISTLFAIIVAGGCYFLGSFGRVLVPNGELPAKGFDEIIPSIVETLPGFLMALVIVLILSASMSTLSSLVMTSSSILTLDLIKPLSKTGMSEKKQVAVMRIFIAVFLLISVILAIIAYQNPATIISTLMSISWGALAGSFLAPFLLGLFWKGVTKTAVFVNFLAGVGITLAHMCYFTLGKHTAEFLGINIASPINAGAFTMLFGMILVPLVSLITKKPDQKQTDEVFACLTDDLANES